jgi:hypothetical protein
LDAVEDAVETEVDWVDVGRGEGARGDGPGEIAYEPGDQQEDLVLLEPGSRGPAGTQRP